MCEFMDTLSVLASLNITVDGLRQTIDGKWEAQLALRYHTDGRVIEALCRSRDPIEALVNAMRQIEWHKANPPVATGKFRGSLNELLGLAHSVPAPRQLSDDDIQSLML